MNFTIDNFDGSGARDYSTALDSEHKPHITRQLNRPAQLLRVADCHRGQYFIAPSEGGRRLTQPRQ